MQISSKAEFELVPKGEFHSFAVREFKLPAFQSPWHFHPECELTCICHGTGNRFVGDNIATFGPGDLVLIGANLPHYWRSDTTAKEETSYARSLVVQFREEFLGAEFLEKPELDSVRKLLHQARRGLQFTSRTSTAAKAILHEMQGKSGLDRLIDLLKIFQLLGNSSGARPLSSPGFSPFLDEFSGKRINYAYQFIFQNFAGPIDYEEMARGAGMSLSAFSHYFKRVTGRTVSSFINEVRIGHAHRLLIESDKSVSEVAYASGFESLSNFNRRFRESSGLSPKEYRQLHQAG